MIGALLHDIGHLKGKELDLETMDNCGVVNHEKIGSQWLTELGLPRKVTEFVEGHVSAKRYLCQKNPVQDFPPTVVHVSLVMVRIFKSIYRHITTSCPRQARLH